MEFGESIISVEDDPQSIKKSLTLKQKIIKNIGGKILLETNKLNDLIDTIQKFGIDPKGNRNAWEYILDPTIKDKKNILEFKKAKKQFIKIRKRVIAGIATVAGVGAGVGLGSLIGGTAITGSIITKAIQNSKNSKRTETKNGIVNNNLN